MEIERDQLLSACRLRDPRGVISVYVDAEPTETAGSPPGWAETVRVALRRVCSRERLRELDPAISRILEAGQGPRGRALFCGVSSGTPVVFMVSPTLQTSVTVAETARLQPLLAARTNAGPAGIVIITAAEVRLLEIADGQARELVRESVAAPKFEWNDLKEPAAARREDARRIVRYVADRVQSTVTARGWNRIVVAGNPRLVRPLAESLASASHGLLVAESDHDVNPHEHPARIASRFHGELEAAAHRRDATLIAQAEDAALAGGRGAIGVDDVLNAVIEGRAAWIALDADAALATGLTVPAGGIPGHSSSVVATDVTAQLVEHALEGDVPLTVVRGAEHPRLQEAGALALLRW